MKRVSSTLSLAILAAVSLAQAASAVLITSDQFVNYATGQLGASGSGGTGNVPGWFNNQAQIYVTNGSHSLNGTDLGLVSSAGDMVSIFAPSNAALGSYNKFVPTGALVQANPTNVYYSFLYRFNLATDVPATGIKISEVNRQNSGFNTGIHWELQARSVGGQVQLGIDKPGGTVTNYATNLLSAGQTAFIVIRQQIITGTANDIDDLWVDPPLNSFGVSESNVPPVSATTSNGTEDPSTTGAGRFWIGAQGQNANFDELRIASTWAEATPAAGQCLNAAISSDPTNITQSAEINASFSVGGLGTSPTYQWQLSQNNGVTWTDIPGAVFANYTSPNLQLATDNGNKYRAIVSVGCNGTSATSAVATVTLTAPTPTPVGLVMDDFFLDGLRNNPPVTTNNSMWFTANSATLYCNPTPPPGYLFGTPISGGSSLWWGNFVDETTTNLPVDLAVGTGIKVTLPFTANGFSAFTNNASLRFGLFDYADGGTLLTEDSAAAGGSTGNGNNVRGYALSVDWGMVFNSSSPLSLLARNGLGDVNLMGTTGDYVSLGSGPSGGGYSNSPAFQAGVPYTLTFTVARTGLNTVTVGSSISGGGTNFAFSATDTNYAYHRFDAFAIRPNSLETSADSFTFPEFKVEVYQASVQAPTFSITAVTMPTPTSVALTWNSLSGVSYAVESTTALGTAWSTNTVVQATASTTSYTDANATNAQQFYRVIALGQ
ncbi:MAG TPA: hypothetical protein VHB20_05815 [Verrucomicrobiae bacterium]|jgi:hypothetical protein|nr:hypothetical protein [Verrucomicrobiae bacterium]